MHPHPPCAQVIHEVCAQHAMDIAGCVADMGSMHEGVVSLRGLVAAGNDALQSGGRSLVESAHALSELVSVQANVIGGAQAVGAARRLLSLCLRVSVGRVVLRG